MSKKWLVRILGVIGVVTSALLVTTPVAAMWDWCEVDPTLSISGHTVALQASMQGDPQAVIGQTVFTVSVPWGTSVSVVSIEKGAKVNINYCGMAWGNTVPVRVNVDIKTKGRTSYKTRLTVCVDGGGSTVLDESTTDRGLNGTFNLTTSGGNNNSSDNGHGNGHGNGQNQGDNCNPHR
jgi:hypothetical protein